MYYTLLFQVINFKCVLIVVFSCDKRYEQVTMILF